MLITLLQHIIVEMLTAAKLLSPFLMFAVFDVPFCRLMW